MLTIALLALMLSPQSGDAAERASLTRAQSDFFLHFRTPYRGGVDRMLATDFSMLDVLGETHGRDKFVSALPADLQEHRIESVRLHSGTAIVTGHVLWSASDRPKRVHFSAVWIKRASKWQMVFLHAALDPSRP